MKLKSYFPTHNKSRRGFLKTVLNAIPTIGITSVLSACSSQNNSQSVIRMGVTSRPRMLDPRKATDALSSRVNRLLYQSLIDFDEQFLPTPSLASWQQLSNKHYRFSLLSKNYFHNGNLLTAEDVVATYQSVIDKNFGSPHRVSFKHVEQIVAVNEQQIDFFLSKEDPLFVGRLVIGILPADLVKKGHSFVEKPYGSAECQLVSNNEQKLVLKRKDETLLEFITVKDATVRFLKLEKGELDMIQNDLAPELLSYCKQQAEQFNVISNKGTGFSYIGFNFDDEMLANIHLRSAIAYSIDRKEIINKLFAGYARLAGGLLVPEHWSGASNLTGFEFNLVKAKQELDLFKNHQGGGEEIELSFKTSSDPTRIRLATIYQSQLKKIGIKLNIQSYDWGTFYSDIKKGRFQLYSLAWVGVKSPDIFQYVFDSNAIPPKGANRGRYRDETADRLIRKAEKSVDLAQQAQIYRQLQTHLQQTLATIPLWYEDQYAVTRKKIQGYQVYSDGRFDGLLSIVKS